MMQKRNPYSFLIDKGKSREQLTYQDILSVKVRTRKEKNSTQYYLQEVQEQSTDISTEIHRNSTA